MGILNVVTGLQLISRVAGGLWQEMELQRAPGGMQGSAHPSTAAWQPF